MVTQCVDTLTEAAVQGWFTVWHKAEIVDLLCTGPQLVQPGGDGIINLYWCEEGSGLYCLFRGLTDLTIDTGVTAGLGGDVVDTQALWPSRREGTWPKAMRCPDASMYTS
jgi:hypothetical protein